MALVLTSKENVAKLLDRPVEQYNVIISRENWTFRVKCSVNPLPWRIISSRQKSGKYSRDRAEAFKGAWRTDLYSGDKHAGRYDTGGKQKKCFNACHLRLYGQRDQDIYFHANYILVPLGFLLGVLLGYATAYSMILSAMQSSGRLMSLPVKASTIGISFGYVLLSYLLAMLLLSRKKALLKLLWQKDE